MVRRTVVLVVGLWLVMTGLPATASPRSFQAGAVRPDLDSPAVLEASWESAGARGDDPLSVAFEAAGPLVEMAGAGRLEAVRAAGVLAAAMSAVFALVYNPAVADTTVTIDPGQVTTLTFGLGAAGDAVVVGSYAYVVDATAVWKVDLSTGTASVFSGNAATAGCVDDSSPGVVRFNALASITTDGLSLFVLDDCPSGSYAPNAIRKVDLASGAASTVVSFTKALNDVVCGHLVAYSGGWAGGSG